MSNELYDLSVQCLYSKQSLDKLAVFASFVRFQFKWIIKYVEGISGTLAAWMKGGCPEDSTLTIHTYANSDFLVHTSEPWFQFLSVVFDSKDSNHPVFSSYRPASNESSDSNERTHRFATGLCVWYVREWKLEGRKEGRSRRVSNTPPNNN